MRRSCGERLYEAEELSGRVGGLKPSRSSLQRLPGMVSQQWEARREAFEEALRVQEHIPKEAVSKVASLNGVLVPMLGERTG